MRKKLIQFNRFLGVAFISLGCCNLFADTLVGKVSAVSDGDTLKITDEDQRITTLRLAGIDAPEIEQDFGQQAKYELSRLCLHQQVDADVRTIDRYGRTVARVRCGGVDAASQLLSLGLAWHFTRYANSQPQQEAINDQKTQEAAANARRGLWTETNPVAPWDWRAQRREAKK